jgi:hypothetical protein
VRGIGTGRRSFTISCSAPPFPHRALAAADRSPTDIPRPAVGRPAGRSRSPGRTPQHHRGADRGRDRRIGIGPAGGQDPSGTHPDTGPAMTASSTSTAQPGRSSLTRPAGGSPGSSAVKAAGRPSVGRGTGPGGMGPRPSGRRGATAAGPGRRPLHDAPSRTLGRCAAALAAHRVRPVGDGEVLDRMSFEPRQTREWGDFRRLVQRTPAGQIGGEPNRDQCERSGPTGPAGGERAVTTFGSPPPMRSLSPCVPPPL